MKTIKKYLYFEAKWAISNIAFTAVSLVFCDVVLVYSLKKAIVIVICLNVFARCFECVYDACESEL